MVLMLLTRPKLEHESLVQFLSLTLKAALQVVVVVVAVVGCVVVACAVKEQSRSNAIVGSSIALFTC